jgi:hypothetical protein
LPTTARRRDRTPRQKETRHERTENMFQHAIILAAAAALAAVGCENGKGTDAASGPKQTVTVPIAPATVTNTGAVIAGDPLANVTNRDQITPDPQAIKIDPPKPAVLVTGLTTTVRESPRGSRIKVLETTASVKEVERDGDYFLVTYVDPKSTDRLLAGWVYRDSLIGEGSSTPVPAVPQKTGKLACAQGESHLRGTNDFCGKACQEDRDCDSAKHQVCDGLATKVGEKPDQSTSTRYCISDRADESSRADDARTSKPNTPGK